LFKTSYLFQKAFRQRNKQAFAIFLAPLQFLSKISNLAKLGQSIANSSKIIQISLPHINKYGFCWLTLTDN